MELLTNIALGIALSACCGFRVFIPLLAGALAGHFQFFSLPADMQWLGSWPAIICFGTAAIAEIAAYYIPFIDNLLDTIATPLSVAAGTVLATSFLPLTDMDPLLRWGTGLLAGGSSAGVIHLGAGLLRLFSSKATVGTGNAIVSTTENAAAIFRHFTKLYHTCGCCRSADTFNWLDCGKTYDPLDLEEEKNMNLLR